MCRNIKRLHNLDPEFTSDEVRDASLQFVRKIAGMTRPSQANAEAFEEAVDDIAAVAERLLSRLTTSAAPLDREELARKARERWERRAS